MKTVSAKSIHLVRHGQTDYNLRRIVQGSGVDSGLNETGRAQASHFYERYREVPFDLVITSGLRRTWESVAHFIDAGIPWEKHADINELCLGCHEGQPGSPESSAEIEAVRNGWAAGDLDGRIGGGESARELGQRLERFLDHLRGRPEQRILICSHGAAMCGLVTLMMGRPLTRMNELRHHNLGLWTATQGADGVFTFDLMNDRGHFPPPVKQSPC